MAYIDKKRSGSKKELKFHTKCYDSELGLYYYGFRYYDPSTCKWLSRDPLGESGGYNLYAFCSNDPVNHVDYLGAWPWDDDWLKPFERKNKLSKLNPFK